MAGDGPYSTLQDKREQRMITWMVPDGRGTVVSPSVAATY